MVAMITWHYIINYNTIYCISNNSFVTTSLMCVIHIREFQMYTIHLLYINNIIVFQYLRSYYHSHDVFADNLRDRFAYVAQDDSQYYNIMIY